MLNKYKTSPSFVKEQFAECEKKNDYGHGKIH